MTVTKSHPGRLAMEMLMGDDRLLNLARRITGVTGCPAVGGIAVFLHGYERTTLDIDVFVDEPERAAAALEADGVKWNGRRKQFEIDGVPVHLVTAEETGGPPGRTTVIRGVRVVGLADLVRMKLTSGLSSLRRAQDIADVVGLVRCVPLDKRFAARLPRELRAAFKKLVDAVDEDR